MLAMKGKILLIALVCFVTGIVHAQSPSKKQIKQHQKNVKASGKDGSMLMSFDTVLYKGEPMMVMLFDRASFSPDLYTVKNLKGETQVVVRKGKKGMMEYTFSKWPHRTAYIKEDSKFGNVGKTIIDNRLIANNRLNEKSAGTFLTMFPQPASQRGVIGRTVDNVLAPAAYKGNQMVDRGREAPMTAPGRPICRSGPWLCVPASRRVCLSGTTRN